MRKQIVRAFLVTGTVTAALTLSVPAAMATGTWTVTGGPKFTSAAASGTTFTLSDTTSGLSFTCTVGTAAGTVTDQSMNANTVIGSITSSTFGSNGSVTAAHKCNGPLSSTFTSTQRAMTTATFNAISFGGGVTTGSITGFDQIMTISSFLGTCTAEIKGTAGYKYTNGSHLLQFIPSTGTLAVTNTSGACSGIIKLNDVVTITSGSEGLVVTGTTGGGFSSPIAVSQP